MVLSVEQRRLSTKLHTSEIAGWHGACIAVY
jgi:hypothetical protein